METLMNNTKDWRTTVSGLAVALPTVLQSVGVENLGHVGNVPGGWLGVIQAIGAIFLGAYATSKPAK